MGGEVLAFFYYEDDKILVDEDGFPVYDIFNFITPNQYFLFLHEKHYMLFKRADGMLIEMFYDGDEVTEEQACLFDRR